jgi:hypothetical protein
MPERTPELLRFELESIAEDMSDSDRLVKWLQAVAREFKEQRPDKAGELGALQTRLRLAWSASKKAVKRANEAGEVDNALVDTMREFDAEKSAVFGALSFLAWDTETASIWDALSERLPLSKRDPNRPLGVAPLDLSEKREKVTGGYGVPKGLAHPSFIEAREVALSLSNGRDGRNWKQIEGALVLFHKSAPGASISIHFDPSKNLLKWWGRPAEVQLLEAELENVPLDGVLLFYTALSWLLESGDLNTSIDALIAAIGREDDAGRTRATRQLWRENVWRWLLVFESLTVRGARRGTWKEPEVKGEKRRKIEEERLTSEDPLLLIKGRRFVEAEEGQCEPLVPKEVSLTLGAWAEQFRGNREILSNLGNVRDIAAIRRGQPSGNWAACVGLMLLQLWRENASRGTLHTRENPKGGATIETLQTRSFTRRELLARSLRPDSDVQSILKSDTPRRAREYWEKAVTELKTRGIIGYYREVEPLPTGRVNWQEAWLNQPLDIRPAGEVKEDALTIHKSSKSARKKGTSARAKSARPGAKTCDAPSD